MGARAWVVFVGLAGCAWIPLSEHQDHLDELGAGASPDGFDAAVVSVTPPAVATCDPEAVVDVEIAVDAGWVGRTLQVGASFDGGPLAALPDATVQPGAGAGVVQVALDPLGCEQTCQVALELSHESGAVEVTEPFTVEVITEPPSILDIVLFDATTGDWVPLLAAANGGFGGRGAALLSQYPRGRIALEDPAVGTPWSAASATVSVVACPGGDDLSPDCVEVVGVDVAEAWADDDADRLVEVDLAPIAEAVCATASTEGWLHVARISDHVCQPDSAVPLHEDLFRIVLDDCDGDGVDWPEDCDDEDATAALVLDWYPDGDGDGWGAEGSAPETECHAPPATAPATGDCVDTDPSVSPGMAEVCDGIDNDCDPVTGDSGVSYLGAVYPTLRDAVTAATTTDPVFVCPGTHNGPLVVDGKDVVVVGVGPPAVITLVPGLLGGPVFEVVAGGSLDLSHVTVRDGMGGPGLLGPSGGAVYADGAGDVTLVDVTVTGNTADYGGGLYARNSGLVRLEDCLFEANEAAVDGGAVWSDGDVVLERTTLISNIAQASGGGAWSGGGDWILEDTTLSGNVAGVAGGGMAAPFGGTIDLVSGASGTLFELGSATNGAGLYAVAATIQGLASFSGNEATGSGGGVHATDCLVDLDGGQIVGNVAYGNGPAGGGLYLVEPASGSELADVELRDNGALFGEGGGLYVDGAFGLALTRATVVSNEATEGGGALVRGGAVSFEEANVSGNAALEGTGGGLAIDSGGVVDMTYSVLADNDAGAFGGGGVGLEEGVWTCDAGTALGALATDNAPDDVRVFGVVLFESYSWVGLANAEIVCTADGGLVYGCQ